MPYAIVETGSKQYKLNVGDRVTVELLPGDAGDEVVLSKVLMVKDDQTTVLGNPYLEKAGVLCTILSQDRGPKIIIYKMKRRKGYRRKMGHRQDLTWLRVDKIGLTGVEAKPAVKKQPKKVASAAPLVARPKKSEVKKPAVKKATARTVAKPTKSKKKE